jgi:hypothetical protein
MARRGWVTAISDEARRRRLPAGCGRSAVVYASLLLRTGGLGRESGHVRAVTTMTCPTCDSALEADAQGSLTCIEDHRYSVIGLALTTNIAALRSLWSAIRALEEDGASLHLMASHYGDRSGMRADDRRAEADAAYDAANTLRGFARSAQTRLDALPSAPAAIEL